MRGQTFLRLSNKSLHNNTAAFAAQHPSHIPTTATHNLPTPTPTIDRLVERLISSEPSPILTAPISGKKLEAMHVLSFGLGVAIASRIILV